MAESPERGLARRASFGSITEGSLPRLGADGTKEEESTPTKKDHKMWELMSSYLSNGESGVAAWVVGIDAHVVAGVFHLNIRP